MRAVAAALEPGWRAAGRPFLMQGADLSRTELAQQMRQLGNAVLFGTDSFWTGVDVPGAALSQVIITRLPFDPPTHPITEAKCEHIRDAGSNPFNDVRRHVITREDDRLTFIDCDFTLTAGEDVSIIGAKHSFFALRAAADISPSYGGTMVNSHGGTGADGTYGKTADWCGYYGKRRLRPDVTEGIVIMNHPENFGGSCPWFTRDYGHLSPSPFNFNKEPWTLAAGKTLRLRYRVALFAGEPQSVGLNDVFRAWVG